MPGATAGQTAYIYDAAGNTTRKVSPTETIDYVYDDANRMAELQTLAGDVTRYAYAANGAFIGAEYPGVRNVSSCRHPSLQ